MTPTEHQRFLFENRPPKGKAGLDRFAEGLVGRFRRGPWARSRLAKLAAQIDTARDQLRSLSDADLDERLKAAQMQRRQKPDRWQEVLVPGLALLAAAAERELRLRAYRVQLMSAAALAHGFFAEVDTGEGKTLAIGLAAAFQAWTGLPCHVITANDYLAARDAANLRRFFARVGLTVGSVVGDQEDAARHEAYACGVTYTTAKEVAADYLRDRLRTAGDNLRPARYRSALSGDAVAIKVVQRGLHAALIDEADHALVDEAVTPLIISRTLDAGEMAQVAGAAWGLARSFVLDRHYQIDRVRRLVRLLPEGIDQALANLDLPHEGLWASKRRRVDLVRQAVEAREFFLRDEHYIVDDDKIVIVDPATGRPMPMRTWQQGLHQIIEAKEGVTVNGASETMARISFQSYFRKYRHLAGASGTLKEAAGELWQTYRVPFVRIPRNVPCARTYAGTRFYGSADSHEAQLVHEIKTRHARGQPVLIGTRTVETSEEVSSLMRRHHLAAGGQVLNARRHREEALLVAQAGQRGSLVIATSMAGRGTDIRLAEGVELLGGLHVVATEANESTRVDRQLIGRAARQGDPGSVIAILSADDAVLKRYIPGPIHKTWKRLLTVGVFGPVPQWLGRGLLRWAQFRSQVLAARSRHRVMLAEVDIQRSLGFTFGLGKKSCNGIRR